MIRGHGATPVAGLVFLAAAVTDFLDGQLARRLGALSQFGKIVDPLADRLLVNSAVVLLCVYDERMWGYEWVVVAARDLIAVYGYRRLRDRVLVPNVTLVGKLGMASMMSGLAWLLLEPHARWPAPLLDLGIALSVAALAHYVWRYRFTLRNPDARVS